ncbi:hypothetical protein MMC25_005435 [Agyrium rufum]|nr:hypothetical protein [Agyrium rufum]
MSYHSSSSIQPSLDTEIPHQPKKPTIHMSPKVKKSLTAIAVSFVWKGDESGAAALNSPTSSHRSSSDDSTLSNASSLSSLEHLKEKQKKKLRQSSLQARIPSESPPLSRAQSHDPTSVPSHHDKSYIQPSPPTRTPTSNKSDNNSLLRYLWKGAKKAKAQVSEACHDLSRSNDRINSGDTKNLNNSVPSSAPRPTTEQEWKVEIANAGRNCQQLYADLGILATLIREAKRHQEREPGCKDCRGDNTAHGKNGGDANERGYHRSGASMTPSGSTDVHRLMRMIRDFKLADTNASGEKMGSKENVCVDVQTLNRLERMIQWSSCEIADDLRGLVLTMGVDGPEWPSCREIFVDAYRGSGSQRPSTASSALAAQDGFTKMQLQRSNSRPSSATSMTLRATTNVTAFLSSNANAASRPSSASSVLRLKGVAPTLTFLATRYSFTSLRNNTSSPYLYRQHYHYHHQHPHQNTTQPTHNINSPNPILKPSQDINSPPPNAFTAETMLAIFHERENNNTTTPSPFGSLPRNFAPSRYPLQHQLCGRMAKNIDAVINLVRSFRHECADEIERRRPPQRNHRRQQKESTDYTLGRSRSQGSERGQGRGSSPSGGGGGHGIGAARIQRTMEDTAGGNGVGTRPSIFGDDLRCAPTSDRQVHPLSITRSKSCDDAKYRSAHQDETPQASPSPTLVSQTTTTRSSMHSTYTLRRFLCRLDILYSALRAIATHVHIFEKRDDFMTTAHWVVIMEWASLDGLLWGEAFVALTLDEAVERITVKRILEVDEDEDGEGDVEEDGGQRYGAAVGQELLSGLIPSRPLNWPFADRLPQYRANTRFYDDKGRPSFVEGWQVCLSG